MVLMEQLRRLPSLAIVALVWALLAQGCSRPANLSGNDDPTARPETAQVPLANVSSRSGAGPGDFKPGIPTSLGASQSLPIGTLLTVRLTDPVWTDAPDANGTFDAVVDEAVSVDGMTYIARGSNVSGRVESAGTSTIRSNRNYVRLTLDSINVGGRDCPIQTSSLFARGKASISAAGGPGDSLAVIHLDKGRRLTFRLTEPVYVASQNSLSTP